MSRFFDYQNASPLAIGVSAVVGAGIAYGSIKFIRKIYDNQPPRKWHKVGEISEVWCFPIKSCGPIALKETNCELIGPSVGHLRDRVFMVARLNGEFIDARMYPKMVRIMPKIEGSVMTLSAPGMSDIQIDIKKLYKSTDTINVTIWKDDAVCIDCGDEAAKWFSEFLLGESKGFRLVFYPSSQPKPVIQDRGYLFEQADQSDTGALHSDTSYMIMNQGSFDDLNTKIDKAVTALQYRPNFVVKGPSAWEEDNWKWVKIGNQTVFKSVQPCTRCILINIDPATGERHPQMEPLKTLKTFRLFKEISSSPYFGIHLGIREQGTVKLGDSVYVNA